MASYVSIPTYLEVEDETGFADYFGLFPAVELLPR